MSSRRERRSLFQGLGPDSGVPNLSKEDIECTCLSLTSDSSIKSSMNLWQIPVWKLKVLSESSMNARVSNSPWRHAQSCGAWVDVIWLSWSSTALGAGVHSTWREVSAPGTDSASADFLSTCSATGLEKKNYLFHTATLAFMIRILDHFFRVWPWLLSHFTAFESFPEAYSQFLLYHFGKSWKLQVHCQFCFYYMKEASRGLINTWLRCLYLLELFYSFVDKKWSVYRKFIKEDLFENCSHFNICGFVGSSEWSACLQNIESFMPRGMRNPQDILAAGFSSQLSAQELTAGPWCRASHVPQALQLPWPVLWEHWLAAYFLSVMAVIWLVHVRSVK